MKYFDYAAAGPMNEAALKVYMDAARSFPGNPGSLHDAGTGAADLLEMSRRQLAGLFHTEPEHIVFTSGGSEGNALGISVLLSSAPPGRRQILSGRTEHASAVNELNRLEAEGWTVEYLDHDENGHVKLADLEQKLSSDTALVVLQHVNSEIGFIQDLQAVSSIIRPAGALLHCDAVQSFGKIPTAQLARFCDSISLSAHKVYGPKGTGAVIFPAARRLKPPSPGVSHEMGFRAGTQDVPGIAAFVTAAASLSGQIEAEYEKTKMLRSFFLAKLRELSVPFELLESDIAQLPHILALYVPGVQGQLMMLELNRLGFAVSTGSACSIGQQKPSNAVLAMGRGEETAKGLVRISFGVPTDSSETEELAGAFAAAAALALC